MKRKIIINDYVIEAKEFYIRQSEKMKIKFIFDVSHEMYHDVTTLLYKNDFHVKVPEEELEFQATIANYFTSITDLYQEGEVGEFTLELIQKE